MTLTIVAINDAPTFSAVVPEFDATEEELADITGISVSDADLMEKITSPLAAKVWMNDPENLQYANKLAVEVRVTSGNVFLGVWAKLNVMRDARQEYVTLASFSLGHDMCKHTKIYTSPKGSPQKYLDVCAFVNAGTSECSTGDLTMPKLNPNCICGLINLCGTEKFLVLYLNRSKDFSTYRAKLKEAITSADKTCGGLSVAPLPNNFTHGQVCRTNADCTPEKLPRCGINASYPCMCCANISMPCKSAYDCRLLEKDRYPVYLLY